MWDGNSRKASTRRCVVMIILQQVYVPLRHSLQMKYLEKNMKKPTTWQLIFRNVSWNRNLFQWSIVSVLFLKGVSKPPSKKKTNMFIVLEMNTFGDGNESVLYWRRTLWVLEMNALKTCIWLQSHNTQLHVATSNFQTDLMSWWLLLTGIHLWKRAVSHLYLSTQ